MVYVVSYADGLGLHHSDETLHKVYGVLIGANFPDSDVTDIVMQWQNEGILFREGSRPRKKQDWALHSRVIQKVKRILRAHGAGDLKAAAVVESLAACNIILLDMHDADPQIRPFRVTAERTKVLTTTSGHSQNEKVIVPIEETFQDHARVLVLHHFNTHILPREPAFDPIGFDNTFVVWFCKTLQNWKALVSTTVEDTRYYEVTHNGDKNETYLDVYVKESNTITD